MVVDDDEAGPLRRILPAVGIGVPLLWLAFSGGGFFAGTTGLAATLAGAVCLLWFTVSGRPFHSLSPAVGIAAGALALLATWTLASSAWSDAPARAVVEFDRVLLYLLAVVVAALALPARRDHAVAVRGFAAALAVVCAAGLTTRLLPDIWTVELNIQADRLGYPVTYWNTLGLMATLCLLTCLHLSSWDRSRWVRVLAAAVFPVAAATLYFTFSRGAIGLAALGLVGYLVLARPRGGLSAVLAIAPPTVAVLVACWSADVLNTERAASAAGRAEGHEVALVLGGAVLVAAVVRWLLLRVDARLEALQLPAATRRRLAIGTALVVVVGVLGVAGGAAASGWAGDQLDRFSSGDVVSSQGDRRGRLVDVGNNGRIDHWKVSIESFRAEPLHGTGAGTYPLEWMRLRPYAFNVVDGHSLYAEVLGELGLVGLALLLALIATLLVGAARRMRGDDRATGAVIVVAIVLWALQAGIDWMWEMPVVTLPVLVLGAMTLGRRGGVRESVADPGRLPRVLVGLGVLILISTPALVAISQDRLDAAVASYRSGDCEAAVDHALGASEPMPVRPEPLMVLGYCDARLGETGLAVDAFQAAVRRDPQNWQAYYGLAIVQAVAGEDPRPAAREARRLNPLSELTRDLQRAFSTGTPQTWRRRATKARLPI
jgi:uncharacterized membrane protein YhaH (DUF805 family)